MMTRNLSRLLFPKSIAFIGGGECNVAVAKSKALGFEGPLWPVNPKRRELGGIATVATLADLPGIPDAAFVAVKREPTIEIVRELSQMGCGGAVIYAAGFAETGDAHLQKALLEAANGMPLMGPNCYGYVNYLAKAALWPDEHAGKPLARGVAVLTQSGNIGVNFTMTRRGLPLAGVFTLGNQADVDIATMIEAFAEDDRISAIGLHIEGLPDVARFAEAAARARKAGKPIVALKTGSSEQGAKVAMSHTSSLAGSDSLYTALFDRFGVARVHSVTEFIETLKFLHHGGPTKGTRLVSMSCSGGEAALVADMAEPKGVTFPPFNEATKPKVAATLNEYVAIDNPLDYHTFIWNQPEKLEATFSAVLSGGFDVGLVILDIPTAPGTSGASWEVTARALAKAATQTGARAAMVATLPECLPEHIAAEMSAAGVAPMAGLDDALSAFAHAAKIGANWAGADPLPLSPAKLIHAPLADITEREAKVMLQAYGLETPQGLVCAPEQAATQAEKLGFPVTVKASSVSIAHKTEAGGVALNLRDAAAVRQASRRMAKLADEVLVERMVKGTVTELIIGITSDEQFGQALVIGAGGIFTELLRDSVTLILPVTDTQIDQALSTLKIAKLIDGFRNRSGDRQAVIRAISAVAAFAQANLTTLEELDVNPLMVLPPGEGAIAVDALIRMRKGKSK